MEKLNEKKSAAGKPKGVPAVCIIERSALQVSDEYAATMQE